MTLVSNVFTDVNIAEVDANNIRIGFNLPISLQAYQAEGRNVFPALLNMLNANINGLSPRPASVLVNKTTNVVNQGNNSQVRDVFTITIVRQAVPGSFVVDP